MYPVMHALAPHPLMPTAAMGPSSTAEGIAILAGRIGQAYRSARRDRCRLDHSEAFPTIFAHIARALQECGLVLQPPGAPEPAVQAIGGRNQQRSEGKHRIRKRGRSIQ